MKFIKKGKATVKEGVQELRYHLHKASCGWEPHRGYKVIHASDLTKEDVEFCPRAVILSQVLNKKEKDGFISTALRTTFDIGILLQDKIVHRMADAGIAICDWKCVACGNVLKFQKRPKRCGCGCWEFKPEEPRFTSEVSGASCGIDTVINLGEPKHRIVEIKTIDKEQFKKLNMPLAEHKLRTNLYLRILEESNDPLSKRLFLDEAILLYISKGGYGTKDETVKNWKLGDHAFSPFKEYRVSRDDSKTNTITQKGRTVKIAREKNQIPKGICPTSFCPRAKKCSMVSECFSGKYPGVNVHDL